MLRVQDLTKTYVSGEGDLTVLKDISFALDAGSSISIVGPSGSGKTTLLGLCAGLDEPSSGIVELGGQHLGQLSEDERAKLRNRLVGFIFQNFQLLPTLTALENVMVPMELRGDRGVIQKAKQLLSRVGLEDRFGHYPVQLSGGEQQRVAMARAFSNKPRILFADEPTGNLDDRTSERVEDLLFEINKEEGTTLVLVTHDLNLARRTARRLYLQNGAVERED